MSPKLSILCLTYNHEKYIEQTLESFVMQQTNFEFDAIIADDASTDGSPAIIKEYAKKYPKIIKPILRKENIGSEANFFATFGGNQSEYISNCEGDDYFTDPFKLQKQVDFLDANPDCSMCFHPVRVFYEDGSLPDEIFPPVTFLDAIDKNNIQLEQLLMVNFIQTNSVLYRWRFNDKESLEKFFPKDILPGDYFTHLLHAQKGRIGFLPEIMGAYRKHSGGIWWESISNPEALHLKYGVQELKFHLALEKTFPEYNIIKGHVYTAQLARYFFSIYLKHKKFPEMQQILQLCPDLFSVGIDGVNLDTAKSV